jgi:hypothetical protein
MACLDAHLYEIEYTQRCRLIFWVECSVGGYLDLAKTYMLFGAKMVLSALAQQPHQHIKLHFCS